MLLDDVVVGEDWWTTEFWDWDIDIITGVVVASVVIGTLDVLLWTGTGGLSILSCNRKIIFFRENKSCCKSKCNSIIVRFFHNIILAENSTIFSKIPWKKNSILLRKIVWKPQQTDFRCSKQWKCLQFYISLKLRCVDPKIWIRFFLEQSSKFFFNK